MAHRIAFLIADGRWPDPNALHRCDNPPCVRRSHLFEGTQKDNAADRQAKGRQNRKPGDLRHSVPRGEAMGRAAKLTAEQVVTIRERAAAGERLAAIAADYAIGAQHVWRIVTRRNWTHL